MDRKTWQTVSRYLLTGLVSLISAAGIIFLFSYLSDKIGWRWPGDGPYEFWPLGGMFGGISTVFTIFSVSKEQFDESLEPAEAFKSTLFMFAIFGVIFILILEFIVTLLLSGNLWFTLKTLAFSLLFFVLLALVIASIQFLSLSLSGFDSKQHKARISNQAARDACKRGQLPYREKVHLFGQSALFFLFFLLMSGLTLIIRGVPDSGSGVLFGSVLTIIFFIAAVSPIFSLSSPNIFTTEGYITKSIKKVRGYRHTSIYHEIYCGDKTFTTDPFIWNKLTEQKQYQFWYTPPFVSRRTGGKILAYDYSATQNKGSNIDVSKLAIQEKTKKSDTFQANESFSNVQSNPGINAVIKIFGLISIVWSIMWFRKLRK